MRDNFYLQLYNMLPSVYRKEDEKIRPNKEPLKRFLKILHEGGFKPLIERIDSLQSLSDIDNAQAKDLHLLVQTLGLEFPYNMSDVERRKYLKIIPAIYKSKGTVNSFNFLAREIFSSKTQITTTAEQYQEGMTPEEYRRIYINIEVDGALPDLQRKEENFRQFAELVRPVNRLLVINLMLTYFASYRLDERARDNINTDVLIDLINNEIYSKSKLDVSKELIRINESIDVFNSAKISTSDSSYLTEKSSSTYNRASKSQDLITTLSVGLPIDTEIKSKKTSEGLISTKFILPRGASLLGSSAMLSSTFYTNNYLPDSLNLTH